MRHIIVLAICLMQGACATSYLSKKNVKTGEMRVLVYGESSAKKQMEKNCPNGYEIIEEGTQAGPVTFNGINTPKKYYDFKCKSQKVSKK